jgi:hypothetical protein
MSGLVVRPGDTLILPLIAEVQVAMTPELSDRIKRAMESQLPGVTVVVGDGLGGSAFVYRPGGAE